MSMVLAWIKSPLILARTYDNCEYMMQYIRIYILRLLYSSLWRNLNHNPVGIGKSVQHVWKRYISINRHDDEISCFAYVVRTSGGKQSGSVSTFSSSGSNNPTNWSIIADNFQHKMLYLTLNCAVKSFYTELPRCCTALSPLSSAPLHLPGCGSKRSLSLKPNAWLHCKQIWQVTAQSSTSWCLCQHCRENTFMF